MNRTMTRAALVACAALAMTLSMIPRTAEAREPRMGLGLFVGDPTGVTGKHPFGGGPVAFDWVIGFGVLEGEGQAGHVDFLWQQPLSEFERAQMDLYFGVGPKIATIPSRDDSFYLGARAPVGLDFMFDRVNLELAIEVAAGLWIIEETDFDLDAGVALRYWF
jgi:hypothetical protein